jgi:hypothetical protein
MSRQRPTDSQIRYPVAPRDVPPTKAARRLGLTLDAFAQVREELLARGFPRPDPTRGNYDLIAPSKLTETATLRNAAEVFGERRERHIGQG